MTLAQTAKPTVTGASGAPTRERANPPHLEHIREHLQRVETGHLTVTDPEAVYLGHRDGDLFWEVIGLRLAGHPSPILGAVPFRMHDFPGVVHSREPLASFLSAPAVKGRGGRPSLAPPGWIPILLPRARETIPGFLKALRAGRVPKPVLIDPSTIELAFDFRLENPFGLASLRRPLLRHLIRTERGHLITGYCHDPLEGGTQTPAFLPIKDPVQHTVQGSRRLLGLTLRRSFITLMVDISDDETRMAAAHWVPFSPASATPHHLLLR
ncbi:MAG: hypothetical protein R3E10_06075 [Gemmatimonadota bacterium]